MKQRDSRRRVKATVGEEVSDSGSHGYWYIVTETGDAQVFRRTCVMTRRAVIYM